jgi:hypothetical protein
MARGGYRQTGSFAAFGSLDAMLEAARRTTERVGQDLLQRTVEKTPIAKPPPGHADEWLISRHRTPGTLRASWQVGEVTLSSGGRVFEVPVFTNDRIAPYVEWPTMPHIIVPRDPAKMLRFWNGLGQTIYASIVHHTGTRGTYMLTTALAEVAIAWQQIGREEMETWAADQARLVAA